ncbi:MAG TPA: leucyl/phenylalanyl-tRNA--protein transferase [Pyrinomonadaceae bacterium]|nr:leucyl/phenylalanyl-tRNA--protein transferase [Pyrinomonadaceae bacterium]
MLRHKKGPETFPDPETFDFDRLFRIGDRIYFAGDIISFGQPLSVENLVEAYQKGIFPWNIEGIPLPWYCPDPRAVLFLNELRIPRSLRKAINKSLLEFTIDKNFPAVIEQCSLVRRRDGKSWIDAEFIAAFTELHRLGLAHSVEAWLQGRLVGGLYGVDAGGVFCGESMFYLEPNASKQALIFLAEHLIQRGANFIDIQVMTPHFAKLGAREIPRKDFLTLLRNEQKRRLKIFN